MKPSLYSPTRYIHLLVECLEEDGLDVSDVLRSFGVDRDLIAHQEAQMAPLQALQLFRALADLSGRSDIGLGVGLRVSYGSFGDTGRAMLSCATLGEALQCWAEFQSLVAPSLSMDVKPLRDCTEVRWIPIRPMPFDFMRVAYDMALGGMDSLLRAVLGDGLPPYDAFMPFVAPPHQRQYERLTRARCHFEMQGLPWLRLCLDNDALRTPMPLSDPAQLRALRRRLSQRVAIAPMQGAWTSWVSMLLEHAIGEQPTLEMLARIVHVTPSTLARHLASEGANFRTLSNEIRHRRACQWLREGQWMVSEISERLGYADVPSFVRAFKAISGVSPTRFGRQPLHDAEPVKP